MCINLFPTPPHPISCTPYTNPVLTHPKVTSAIAAFHQGLTDVHGFILGAHTHWVSALLLRIRSFHPKEPKEGEAGRERASVHLLLMDSVNKPFGAVMASLLADGTTSRDPDQDPVQEPAPSIEPVPNSSVALTVGGHKEDDARRERHERLVLQLAQGIIEDTQPKVVERLRSQFGWRHHPESFLRDAFENGVPEYHKGREKNLHWWRYQPRHLQVEILVQEMNAVCVHVQRLVSCPPESPMEPP